MPARQLTPMDYVTDYLQTQIENRQKVVVNNFIYVGETCIREARLNGTYQDRTGNLRSSIGYVVLRDGVSINQGGFEQVLTGEDGIKSGKEFIQALIAKYRKGIVLIVVAGMEYAAYVEALNYDVLTSAELLAERTVPQLMTKLGFKVAA